jgi:hypothetical protein
LSNSLGCSTPIAIRWSASASAISSSRKRSAARRAKPIAAGASACRRPTFNLLASHQDQVVKLPPRAKLIAASDFCPHAGFTIDDHIVTFQGHPEFVKGYSRALLEARRQALGEDVFARGVESLDEPVDSALVARWIINFMARERARREHR